MGSPDDNRHLEEADRKFIWHPFTQMQDWVRETPVIIEEGKDCRIRDVNGKWYLDGVSSLWVTLHGHRRKEIDDAVRDQIGRIAHSTLLGLGNVPSIKLAERLCGVLRKSFGPDPHVPQKVFYSDNGSTAVEVALKMAFQYWTHKSVKGKHAFLSLGNAYHGDTIGAVSVGGVEMFHDAFSPLLFKTFRAPSPYCYRCEVGKTCNDCSLMCIKAVESILEKHHDEIAAMIIEPLVQAAGGMIVFPSGYLKAVRDLCRMYDVLFIADEVATGFGRTGRMFACEHENVVPDIICLSKGITGGYLPLAVTVATEEIYHAFLGEFSELKTFFHGHSYTGNPLACAAAVACLEIFEKEKTLLALQPKITLLEKLLTDIYTLPHVGDVRNKGLMAGIELVADKEMKTPYPWEEKRGWRVARHARDNGVFLRPLGNVIVIMPPLSISEDDLTLLLEVVKNGIIAST